MCLVIINVKALNWKEFTSPSPSGLSPSGPCPSGPSPSGRRVESRSGNSC